MAETMFDETSINNKAMMRAIDACNDAGVRCVEIWFGGALKIVLTIEIDGERHVGYFMLAINKEAPDNVFWAVAKWIEKVKNNPHVLRPNN